MTNEETLVTRCKWGKEDGKGRFQVRVDEGDYCCSVPRERNDCPHLRTSSRKEDKPVPVLYKEGTKNYHRCGKTW